MPERTDVPRNNSHPGSKPLTAFALCLILGPLGLLYLGIPETVTIGLVYLAGLGVSYWIWPSMLPEFIGFSLVLLAFAAKRWAAYPLSNPFLWVPRRPFARALPMAGIMLFDLGMLCIGEAILEQFWMEYGKVHILGIFLSLCISLPIGFLLVHALRENILRRISR